MIKLKNFLLLLIIAILISIAPKYILSTPLELNGYIKSGTYLIKSDIDGFDAKFLPSIGCGIDIGYSITERLNMGLEVSLLYAFKSNNANYFYYGPFYSLIGEAFADFKIIKLKRWAVIIGIKAGVNPLVTDYNSAQLFVVTGYTGIVLLNRKKRFFKGVNLSYTHGSIDGYKLNETVLLELKFLLYRSKNK